LLSIETSHIDSLDYRSASEFLFNLRHLRCEHKHKKVVIPFGTTTLYRYPNDALEVRTTRQPQVGCPDLQDLLSTFKPAEPKEKSDSVTTT
jgi:hypothetical protein